MSVTKFRFVSPGVQVNEIDNSQIPRIPTAIGPVVIGRSLRGPMMRPVSVQSFSDFVDVFGEPLAGGQVGDVWRDGNRLTPTYGAYAAQAHLRFATSPVTFVRLGGFQNRHELATNAELAGWKVNEAAYGLFVAPTTGSGVNWTVDGTASLAAILYSDISLGLTGRSLTGSSDDVVNKAATWVRIDGTYAETRLAVGSNSNTFSFNLDKDSKKYIRNILNTNPTALDTKSYFLGETFESYVDDTLPNLAATATAEKSNAVILLKLKGYENFKQEAQDAQTGWIVSQHLGATGSYVADGDGKYPVQQLFRVVGLTEGEWNSQNLKVTIEDIKLPLNEYVKYGTFTLSIRKVGDNDVTPQYVERFTGLNLDPSSENYIAKRLGDKYTEWNYEKQAYEEYGTYDNNSKFVRVEMNENVDAGKAEPSLLPFGFYGPTSYKSTSNLSGADGTYVTLTNTFLVGNSITGANPWTASFGMPEVPLLTTSDDSAVSALSSVHWGLLTNIPKSKKTNYDYPDFVRALPAGFVAASGSLQFMFSLDDVSASVAGTGDTATIEEFVAASWKQDNRYKNKSVTSNASISGLKTLLSKFNKFTVPMIGGFDGLDVREPDPFANSVLQTNTSYAYNSVKVAINSISDPEIVEMNLATMPGITNAGLNGMLLEKCEVRGDALAIVDLEGDYDPENPKVKPSVDTVVDNVKDYPNTSYGCSYFPWVMIRDTLSNRRVWVPPSVVALGTFASSERRTELWFAPAGFNRGGLSSGAAGLPVLQTALKLTSKDRDALYEANINPIASFPAEGIVIFGQKTLQVTPSALDRINVRRLMIYLKKEISRMATTVLFDPNIKITWARFLNMANPFLASVQSRFGLTDYRVILDETTTTPDLVDRNIVYAKILLKPARAIEFIALDFVITNTGASFAD